MTASLMVIRKTNNQTKQTEREREREREACSSGRVDDSQTEESRFDQHVSRKRFTKSEMDVEGYLHK